MKGLRFLIVIGVFLIGGALQAAGLQVSEAMIEYGTIKEGPPVFKTIELSNNGTEPVIIQNVRAS